jgi:hypothetical protein
MLEPEKPMCFSEFTATSFPPALRQGKKKPQKPIRFLGFSFMAFRSGLA